MKKITFSVNSNTKELKQVFQNLENEKLLVGDLTLHLSLIKIFTALHHSFDFHFNRLSHFQTSFNNLLLDTKNAIQIDLIELQRCVLNKEIVKFIHGKTFVSNQCYLTSNTKFSLHHNFTEFLRVQIHHLACLYDKSGLISKLDNEMFISNLSHFHSVSGMISIPKNCLKLEKSNNKQCRKFFDSGPKYKYQCRKDIVFATGQISYEDQKLNTYKLNLVHQEINEAHYPIKIGEERYFKDFFLFGPSWFSIASIKI